MFILNGYNDAMTDNSSLIPTKQIPKPAIRAYLGGSFNPVHNAHIEMAMQVYTALAPLANHQHYELQVSLLPNARSPFKQQSTDPKHRLAMLKLAVQDTPLHIDELELWQEPPVYTIDSVRTLRQRYPSDCLIFIMGMDSARSLEHWKQGLQLTDYVNLWLFDRSDRDSEKYARNTYATDPICNSRTFGKPVLSDEQQATLISELPHQLQRQVVNSISELIPSPNDSLKEQPLAEKPLKTLPKGRIYIDLTAIKKISSTEIRKHLPHSLTTPAIEDSLLKDANYLSKHLHPAVYDYIVQHKLYSVD